MIYEQKHTVNVNNSGHDNCNWDTRYLNSALIVEHRTLFFSIAIEYFSFDKPNCVSHTILLKNKQSQNHDINI